MLDLEEKFRTVGLDRSDCSALAAMIEKTDDHIRLGSLLYMFGYSCGKNSRVRDICLRFIDDPHPYLTAKCLKLVVDYWEEWADHIPELMKYLDMDLYDEWYDEVIVSASFVSRNLSEIAFPEELRQKFLSFRADPRSHDLDDVL